MCAIRVVFRSSFSLCRCTVLGPFSRIEVARFYIYRRCVQMYSLAVDVISRYNTEKYLNYVCAIPCMLSVQMILCTIVRSTHISLSVRVASPSGCSIMRRRRRRCDSSARDPLRLAGIEDGKYRTTGNGAQRGAASQKDRTTITSKINQRTSAEGDPEKDT